MNHVSGAIRVLHVDDEPDFADMAATFLERENDRLTVETATSAHDGLERLVETEYDCVVSDYDMPGTNGIEFLKQVREDSSDLPFILFTGKGSEEVASEAISAGVTDYLQKESKTEQYALLANRITNAVEQYRTRLALRAREQRLQALLEYSTDRLFILDEDGTYQFVSPAVERILGYTPDEMEGKPSREFIHPADRDKVAEVYQEVLANPDEVFTFQYRVQHKDGSWRWVEARECNRSEIDGVVVNSRDITERKERERELERYQRIVEAMGDGIYAVDADGDPIEVNDQFAAMTGYEAEEILREGPDLILSDADIAKIEQAIRTLLDADERGVQSVEVTIQQRDGDTRPVESNVTLLPGEGFRGTVGVIRDITKRKERERELEQYETIVETIPVGVGVIDEEGVIIEGNNRAAEILGYDLDDMIDEPFERLVEDGVYDEGFTEQYLDHVRELLSRDSEREHARIEYTITVDGEERHIESYIALRPIEEEYRGTISVFQDVTEQKERQRRLANERDRFESLFETLPEPVALVSGANPLDSTVSRVNSAFEEVFGYQEAEIVDEHLNDIVVPEDRREEGEQLDQENVEDSLPPTEVRRKTADGELRDFLLLATNFEVFGEDDVWEGFAIYADITDRVETEQELRRQNERLDEFASIISHDLRNPLTVATGRLELAQADCESDHLDSVANALDRMGTIIEETLTLAREGQSVGEMEPVALADIVERCWQTVETDNADLRVEDGVTISGDPDRLRHLFENLFRNAVEHGGKNVSIRVGGLGADGFYVEDDGPGIPVDDHEDVFKPGYTTTEESTGFGLAIVKEIAEAHGWEITITNGEEGGARFEFTNL